MVQLIKNDNDAHTAIPGYATICQYNMLLVPIPSVPWFSTLVVYVTYLLTKTEQKKFLFFKILW